MTGILKGLGKVEKVSTSTFLLYYFVALPLMYTLSIRANFRLAGIWLGYSIANAGLIIYFSYELYCTDWKSEAIKLLEKLEYEDALLN